MGKQLFILFFGVFVVSSNCIKLFGQQITVNKVALSVTNPEKLFLDPPKSAYPGVLWMWMGSNISKEGITKDLEALKKEGFSSTTMFSLADVTTPWAGIIKNSPTPDVIAWTEPWWKMVRYAATESKRLGMNFGMFNCPGYESSGGPWITPELSMQEICWSSDTVSGGKRMHLQIKRPRVNPRGHTPFPIYNHKNGRVEIPEVEARSRYYKDIAVLALPATGIVPVGRVINLTSKVKEDGALDWIVPEGKWIIYRFGHTTTGTYIQPAQWQATGLECDKMSQKAVNFHIDHVIGEIKRHLGDLIGTGFESVHFDSYEAGTPTWTPKMPEEFKSRRGYDLIPYLPVFAGRIVGRNVKDSLIFRKDFDVTIKDLYRDVYFATLSKKLNAANLTFLCEPYGGPWRQNEIMPYVDRVMTEFWTFGGNYSPFELKPTVQALRESGQNIIEAEAFTSDPHDSKWDKSPEWLKPIGDAAFCDGVNRLVIHRFVQQPWDDKYQPGLTMGEWGTHFDRTQTWWKPAKAMVKYWQRCQALLQWGHIEESSPDDFQVEQQLDSITIRHIHRKLDSVDIYFVANVARSAGKAMCSFKIKGRQPELWDPVTGQRRDLPGFTQTNTGRTVIPLAFDKAQSFFIVFRKKITKMATRPESLEQLNFLPENRLYTLQGPWAVQFDPRWGGPKNAVIFDTLQDWTKSAIPGIKYFSGTAVYKHSFKFNLKSVEDQPRLFLNLGTVKHIARVKLNGQDLGVVWTAPWRIQIPAGLLKNNNILEIAVTNVWANRLIGDEQEPADCEWLPGHREGHFLKSFPEWFLKGEQRPSKGRYCFTSWNYFDKHSPLVTSGLLGPVTISSEPANANKVQ